MNEPNLLELYQAASKHSHYQVLPAALETLLRSEPVVVKPRHETARLAYVESRLNVSGLRAADIGGNTGFFSFELLDRGAREVDYYEGNQAHYDFVRACARQLGLSERLHTFNRYVTFQPDELPAVDCTVLLNVLHHLGDDFGQPDITMEAARQNILGCLAALSRWSRLLVFQLGFNWKGDRRQPLFPHGTKSELIDFVAKGTALDWAIDSIGIAEPRGNAVVFNELDHANIERDDALGEFLNRPIFVMRSRHF